MWRPASPSCGASLARTGAETLFAFHILSDSSRPEVVAAEMAAFGATRRAWPIAAARKYRLQGR